MRGNSAHTSFMDQFSEKFDLKPKPVLDGAVNIGPTTRTEARQASLKLREELESQKVSETSLRNLFSFSYRDWSQKPFSASSETCLRNLFSSLTETGLGNLFSTLLRLVSETFLFKLLRLVSETFSCSY